MPTEAAPTDDALAVVLARSLQSAQHLRGAWLFGSHAKGRATEQSDIDIAVLVGSSAGLSRYDLQRELIDTLAGAVAAERVHLVFLDDAPPALAFRVLAHGRLLVCNDEQAVVRFKVSVFRAHSDFAHAEEIFRRATRARALAGSRHG